MSVDDERFWQSLRKASQEAGEESPSELQAAEEELRQLEAECAASDDAGQSNELAPEEVDRWVKNAIAAAARDEADSKETDWRDTDWRDTVSRNTDSESSDAPESVTKHSPRRSRPWQTLFAAAAAFLVTPKFLVAATVVAGIAVTTTLLQSTTTTLPFEHAVQLLMDAEQSAETREAAGGRVYFDVAETVMAITELTDASGMIANSANDAIEQLRTQMTQPPAFSQASFTQSLPGVTEQLMQSQLNPDESRPLLDELVRQASYGIQALRAIDARAEIGALHTNTELHLMQIQRLLDR